MDGELARIFIGRLSPRTQERDLEHIFSAYGRSEERRVGKECV